MSAIVKQLKGRVDTCGGKVLLESRSIEDEWLWEGGQGPSLAMRQLTRHIHCPLWKILTGCHSVPNEVVMHCIMQLLKACLHLLKFSLEKLVRCKWEKEGKPTIFSLFWNTPLFSSKDHTWSTSRETFGGCLIGRSAFGRFFNRKSSLSWRAAFHGSRLRWCKGVMDLSLTNGKLFTPVFLDLSRQWSNAVLPSRSH